MQMCKIGNFISLDLFAFPPLSVGAKGRKKVIIMLWLVGWLVGECSAPDQSALKFVCQAEQNEAERAVRQCRHLSNRERARSPLTGKEMTSSTSNRKVAFLINAVLKILEHRFVSI